MSKITLSFMVGWYSQILKNLCIAADDSLVGLLHITYPTSRKAVRGFLEYHPWFCPDTFAKYRAPCMSAKVCATAG